MSDGPRTPKESGSLERWPIFEGLAKEAAGRLAAAGHVQESKEARSLAIEFASWEKRDPGQSARMLALSRLFTFRELVGL